MRRRNEHAQGAVGGLEVLHGDALHILAPDLAQAVAVQEEQAPVAHADVFGQRDAQLARTGQGHLEIVEQPRARAFDFLVRDRLRGNILQCRDQGVTRRIQRHVLAQAGAEVGVASFPLLLFAAEGAAGLAAYHQRLVQPARRHPGERGDQDVDRGVIGMGSGRQVVERADDLHVADAAQGHATLAVLHRLGGVGGRQFALRPGNPAEMALDEAQRRRLVESAAHQQHGVVRLIVAAIESLQALDRHVFDVGARADDGAAVVVPQIGGRGHALAQHGIGAVLARFKLVAHHRHLAVEVFPGHPGIDHAVGFQTERPVELLLVGGKGFEIIGAVERSRAVEAGTVALELVLDLRMPGRALEQHVLEQVRHAGFAVALVARADQVGNIDGDGVLRGVGKEQDLEPVRQPVLGNALDRGDFADRFGIRRACRNGANRRGQERWQQQD